MKPCSGLYWGYTVRVAKDLSTVFTGSPFKGGYDVTLGTSEKVNILHDKYIDDKYYLSKIYFIYI